MNVTRDIQRDVTRDMGRDVRRESQLPHHTTPHRAFLLYSRLYPRALSSAVRRIGEENPSK